MKGVYFMSNLSRYAKPLLKETVITNSYQDKVAIFTWLMGYPFQSHIILTLINDQIDNIFVNKMLNTWANKVSKEEGIVLCYLGVITSHYMHSRKHVHLLIYGTNKSGKLIKDCKKYTFKKYWRGTSSIKYFNNDSDHEKTVRYIVEKNMGYSFEVINYNEPLLNYLRKSNKNVIQHPVSNQK
jgi:hypothetical protein